MNIDKSSRNIINITTMEQTFKYNYLFKFYFQLFVDNFYSWDMLI